MTFDTALASLTLCACGAAPCPGVQYEGKASDEAYLSMVDGEARAIPDPTPAPAFQFADGTTFSASQPPTLTWTSALTASAAPLRTRPRRAPGEPFWRGLLVSQAWAHLPPVTGAIFWLKLSTPGQSCGIEVLTTDTKWTPSAQVWALISKGTGATTVTGYSAYVVENRITEGPYVSPAPSTFTVSR